MASERCECCGEGKDPVAETDAFGFREDQRLDGTSADAAAYRRNSWLFG